MGFPSSVIPIRYFVWLPLGEEEPGRSAGECADGTPHFGIDRRAVLRLRHDPPGAAHCAGSVRTDSLRPALLSVRDVR